MALSHTTIYGARPVPGRRPPGMPADGISPWPNAKQKPARTVGLPSLAGCVPMRVQSYAPGSKHRQDFQRLASCRGAFALSHLGTEGPILKERPTVKDKKHHGATRAVPTSRFRPLPVERGSCRTEWINGCGNHGRRFDSHIVGEQGEKRIARQQQGRAPGG